MKRKRVSNEIASLVSAVLTGPDRVPLTSEIAMRVNRNDQQGAVSVAYSAAKAMDPSAPMYILDKAAKLIVLELGQWATDFRPSKWLQNPAKKRKRNPVKKRKSKSGRVRRAGLAAKAYIRRPSQITRKAPTKRLRKRRTVRVARPAKGFFPNPGKLKRKSKPRTPGASVQFSGRRFRIRHPVTGTASARSPRGFPTSGRRRARRAFRKIGYRANPRPVEYFAVGFRDTQNGAWRHVTTTPHKHEAVAHAKALGRAGKWARITVKKSRH